MIKLVISGGFIPALEVDHKFPLFIDEKIPLSLVPVKRVDPSLVKQFILVKFGIPVFCENQVFPLSFDEKIPSA